MKNCINSGIVATSTKKPKKTHEDVEAKTDDKPGEKSDEADQG